MSLVGVDAQAVEQPVQSVGELVVQGAVQVRRDGGGVGVAAGRPGLYFLGLSWQHTRGSALLGFVKDDAAYLADRIMEYQQATTPAGTAAARRP